MLAQGNSGNRDEKNENQGEIDPIGILGEQLAGLDLVKWVKDGFWHNSIIDNQSFINFFIVLFRLIQQTRNLSMYFIVFALCR